VPSFAHKEKKLKKPSLPAPLLKEDAFLTVVILKERLPFLFI
jgi:hypothetical protein